MCVWERERRLLIKSERGREWKEGYCLKVGKQDNKRQ